MRQRTDKNIQIGLKAGTEALSRIAENAPCGLICFAADFPAQITYINSAIKDIMRIAPEDDEKAGFYMTNLYLAVAAESREPLAAALDILRAGGDPITGEISVMRADGSKARIFGRVELTQNEDGKAEFFCSCFDITEHYKKRQKEHSYRYRQALAGVYDLVFEFDLAARTMKCLKSDFPGAEALSADVSMQAEEAVANWVRTAVAKENRGRVHGFLDRYVFKGGLAKRDRPPRTRFKIRDEAGTDFFCQGALLCAEETRVYFCACRAEPKNVTSALTNENRSLKGMNENLLAFVKRFADDFVALEVKGEMVRLLCASENACSLFGLDSETWSRFIKRRRTVREVAAQTGMIYDELERLLKDGEAEFIYKDVRSGKRKSIRAVCAGNNENAGKRYVLLYSAEPSAKAGEEREEPSVYIRTFGYFDVFVDGKPVLFKNEKAKELFALLVDRRGGYVSAEEAIAILWEDEPASPLVLSRYRKIALRLKNLLEEYGISDVVEYVNGKRRIVTEQVSCDLYRHLKGDKGSETLFTGNYLTNYSWGEVTLAELERQAGRFRERSPLSQA